MSEQPRESRANFLQRLQQAEEEPSASERRAKMDRLQEEVEREYVVPALYSETDGPFIPAEITVVPHHFRGSHGVSLSAHNEQSSIICSFHLNTPEALRLIEKMLFVINDK